MHIDIAVNIESYIAHPYWPEREKFINIIKQSGVSRARTELNRSKALTEHLEKSGMTLADYDALQDAADRPFHTDAAGMVLIPKRSVDGMLTEAADRARAATKACDSSQVRTAIRASSWSTNAPAEKAGTWERFVVVTAGTGAKLSNQRALRVNEFIGDTPPDDTLEPGPSCTATGHLEIDEDMVSAERLHVMLTWAGKWIGIGASRKMGWGRFAVTQFETGKEPRKRR